MTSRPKRRQSGSAAVEMALVTPVLLILLAGIIDFSRAFYEEVALSAAVAAAAEYALLNASNVSSAGAATLAATLSGIVANSNGSAWAGATVVVNDGATSAVNGGSSASSGTAANADSCWCPSGSPGSVTWGEAAACGTNCEEGTLAGKFVAIDGTRAFTAIFGDYGLIGSRTLHQGTIVQTQ